jgi:hypothetical protein
MTTERDTQTVCEFMTAAQTILALYASPDGPTDPAECYRLVSEILEAPSLLAAQMRLGRDHGFVIILGGNQSDRSLVM